MRSYASRFDKPRLLANVIHLSAGYSSSSPKPIECCLTFERLWLRISNIDPVGKHGLEAGRARNENPPKSSFFRTTAPAGRNVPERSSYKCAHSGSIDQFAC